jgi:CBS domain-containing protein
MLKWTRRRTIKVRDVLSADVIVVAPEAPLKEVAELLFQHRISGVPVTDRDGKVLGVVSEADFVRKEASSDAGRKRAREGPVLEARTAGEAMTSPAITVGPECDVYEAARLMTDRRVNRLPVTDAEGKLVGIVTRADLVRAFVRSDDEIERELREEVVLRTLWIDPEDVWISVDAGEVRLAGKLGTKADAELLEYFASRVPGVVSVHSTLRWQIDEPRLQRSDPRIPIPQRGTRR